MAAFGAAAGGGGSAIQEAMQSRGMDPGILNQITPGAPTAPDRLPPTPVGASPPSAIPGQARAVPQEGPGSPPTPESTILVKAMDSRLKKLGDLQEMGIPVQ